MEVQQTLDGEAYARASYHQKQWGKALLQGLTLRGSERVLDLGCGDGALTHWLARHVPGGAAVGIDKSASMIAKARQLRAPNLSFQVMPMEHLASATLFDVVFSNAAVHWVHDHARLLHDVYELLRPGGRLLFQMPGSCPATVLKPVVTRKTEEEPYCRYFPDGAWPWYEPDREVYRRLLARTGFESIAIQDEEVDVVFTDADEVLAWLGQPTLVPFVRPMTAQHARAFAAAVSREVLGCMRRVEDRYIERVRRFKVSAQKPAVNTPASS